MSLNSCDLICVLEFFDDSIVSANNATKHCSESNESQKSIPNSPLLSEKEREKQNISCRHVTDDQQCPFFCLLQLKQQHFKGLTKALPFSHQGKTYCQVTGNPARSLKPKEN